MFTWKWVSLISMGLICRCSLKMLHCDWLMPYVWNALLNIANYSLSQKVLRFFVLFCFVLFPCCRITHWELQLKHTKTNGTTNPYAINQGLWNETEQTRVWEHLHLFSFLGFYAKMKSHRSTTNVLSTANWQWGSTHMCNAGINAHMYHKYKLIELELSIA